MRDGIQTQIQRERGRDRLAAFGKSAISAMRSSQPFAQPGAAVPWGVFMTTFDEREHAFEEKYAHDEELRFKARVRRDKRLGLWAAEKLGKSGPEAENYAASLAVAEMRKDSAEQILKTLRADFDRASLTSPTGKFAKRWMSSMQPRSTKSPKVRLRQKQNPDTGLASLRASGCGLGSGRADPKRSP